MNQRSNWPTTSKQSRGYGGYWETLRKAVMRRDNGLCQCRHCKASGAVTVAHECDHIVPKAKAVLLGWTKDQIDSMDNLQAINRDCHTIKNAEDEGRTPRARVIVGSDGFPV